MKTWELVFAALVVVLNLQSHVHGVPQVPCYFIFGDSLADNGNNNLLQTKAKANYPPYGIDFPNGPTGRFTNGLTTFDMIAQLLGFDKLIPPFATTNDSDILQGVNYASGAAGIRQETGNHMGDCISLGGQLKNHWVTVSRIIKKLGNKYTAMKYLNKCLYSVGMGNNDYINNYFMPKNYNTSHQYTPAQYARVLIRQYSRQIETLYHDGARKFALFGAGVVGCTPNSIFLYGTKGKPCVEEINTAVTLFNQQLISLVDNLNRNLTGAKAIYVNSYQMGSGDPSVLGFKVTDVGCCPVDQDGQCTPSKTPCQNRTEYVFWDAFHPTEAANRVSASRSYKAYLPNDTYPIDISHLVQL
jgi:phospholipase/lecithinase/hemolysin